MQVPPSEGQTSLGKALADSEPPVPATPPRSRAGRHRGGEERSGQSPLDAIRQPHRNVAGWQVRYCTCRSCGTMPTNRTSQMLVLMLQHE